MKLPHSLIRLIGAALFGAVCGALALQLAYLARPGFTLELDRPMPASVTGFHGEERVNRETYAWTRREVTMPLPGLDRSGEWTCVVRLRGGRQDESTLPQVITSVDGIVVGRHGTSNDFLDIKVPLAPRAGRGATITLTVSNTFVPGGGDKRELGVYIDRWTCSPAVGTRPLAPPDTLQTAAIVAAAFAGALALTTLPLWALALVIMTLAGLQSLPLVWDLGPFLQFAVPPAALGGIVAAGLAAAVLLAPRLLGRPLSRFGSYVLFVTAAVLYLKLLALTHPGKLIIDIVFHAHRLMWVLDGRYYFTQPMPSGVSFPYAIGLYVFAMPWTLITTDFVTLLRVVVVAAECAGGLLLYYLIARFWDDRRAGAIAVTLYACVPRTYEIVGNANMTNAFGQSMALAVLAAATSWSLSFARLRTWTGFMLLLAAALLCHISTFTTLGAILAVLAVLYWTAARPPMRREALAIAGAAAVAAVIAIVLYYGHFGDAYRSALRVRAATPAAATGAASPATTTPAPTAGMATKLRDAGRLSVQAVGWPIALLAIPGFVAWVRRGWRDRLGLLVAALAITFAIFMAGFLVAPVDQSFHRYAVEFVSRITLATYPVMVVWAGLGASWLWSHGRAGQIIAMLMVVMAGRVAITELLGWIR